jgi:hypothetical protein
MRAPSWTENLHPNRTGSMPVPALSRDGYPSSPRMKSRDQTRVYKESHGGGLESRMPQAFPRQNPRRADDVA